MTKPSAVVQEWFRLANIDLVGAKSLYDLNNKKLWPLVAYHCQQVIEKAIKGYLAHQKIKFSKTHDIAELKSLIDSKKLILSLEDSDQLTPYAVGIRYPDAAIKEIEKDDVEIALKIAIKAYDAILSEIPFNSQWDI